uniref:Putative secreted peptide n=1 Tax=Anopheles braziliensis TaxID=58242 RepID=A0A2M3ZV64_9DIPT
MVKIIKVHSGFSLLYLYFISTSDGPVKCRHLCGIAIDLSNIQRQQMDVGADSFHIDAHDKCKPIESLIHIPTLIPIPTIIANSFWPYLGVSFHGLHSVSCSSIR